MTTTTYDPTSTAASLAQAYTSGAQTLLTTQTNQANQSAAALTQLQSALTAFDTALTGLSGKSSVLSQTADFSDTSVGTASASGSAAPGTYSFFVQQLATANQVAYANLAAVPASQGGNLVVNLAGGQSFNVDLTNADLDHDGTLTPTEMATAINQASGNDSLVTASLVTVNGQSQMVLSSDQTGAAGAISLDTSGVGSAALKATLAGGNQLVAAQDAIVWLGAQGTGIQLQQGSNTFDAVSGVSITFKRAMASGEAPTTLTVATDDSGTAANMQSFVDAYNTLTGVLNTLTSAGDASKSVAAGAFADDSSVRALRSKLESLIRQNVGGVSLATYGVIANTDGTLSLDQTKLSAKLATNPDGLDTLLGNTGLTNSSGVLGGLDSYLNVWTNVTTGQIKQRQDGVTQLQQSLTAKQTSLNDQYNSAYARYLAQFTQLQNLQAQMSQTSSMFDALFGSGSSSS
jgi:flagellar hook-associated protein 2